MSGGIRELGYSGMSIEDGETICSWGVEGLRGLLLGSGSSIVIWDPSVEKVIKVLDINRGKVTALGSSPDGAMIASGESGLEALKGSSGSIGELGGNSETKLEGLRGPSGSMGVVKIINGKTFEVLKELSNLGGPITAIRFSFDGKFLSIRSGEGLVTVFSTSDFSLITRLQTEKPITGFAWSPTQPELFCCDFFSIRRFRCRFEASALKFAAEPRSICVANGMTRDLLCSNFSPCGRYFIGGTLGGELMVFDTTTEKSAVVRAAGAAVSALAKGEKGEILAAVGGNKVMRFKVVDGKVEALRGWQVAAKPLAIASVGKKTLVALGDGSIVDLSTQPMIEDSTGPDKRGGNPSTPGSEGSALSCGVAVDALTLGGKVIVLRRHGGVDEFDASTLRKTQVIRPPRADAVARCFAASPDGKTLFIGYDSGELAKLTPQAQSSGVEALRSPGVPGSRGSGLSSSKSVGVEALKGWCVESLPNAHKSSLQSLSAGSNYLISSCSSGFVRIWRSLPSKPLSELNSISHPVLYSRIHPTDPSRLILALKDRKIIQFSLEAPQKPKNLFSLTNGRFRDLVFTDQSEVITCGDNMPLCVFTEKSGLKELTKEVFVAIDFRKGRVAALGESIVAVLDIKGNVSGKFGVRKGGIKVLWTGDDTLVVVNEDGAIASYKVEC